MTSDSSKWSPERRARTEAKQNARNNRNAQRKQFLVDLETKALAGEPVGAEDFRRIAIADAIAKLSSNRPATRAEGQAELEKLCPPVERGRGNPNAMIPRH